MKALSLQQPWASWVLGIAPRQACGAVAGVKDIENRSWSVQHRGDLVIHAGRSVCKAAMNMYWGEEDPAGFPTGALLGVVRLVDIKPPEMRCTSPFAMDGQYHWQLSFPRPFQRPLPWRGQQGLFDVYGEELQAAVTIAEYDARRLFRAMPEDDRAELVELAAVAEDRGVAGPLANRLAIEAFQKNRALRAHLDQQHP